MVWFGKDLKDHPVLTPCHGHRHLPLEQVAQSTNQPGLDINHHKTLIRQDLNGARQVQTEETEVKTYCLAG